MRRPALGSMIYFTIALVAGAYFTFAAVQGSFGIFRRVEIEAESAILARERDGLKLELARMTNLTRRLSDSYLDTDLLDERARDLLGLMRGDEIVIR